MSDYTCMRISIVVTFAVLLGACASAGEPPATAPSSSVPPASVAVSASTRPRPSPTVVAGTSPTPIAFPTIAQLSAPSATVVWALVGGSRLFVSTDRGDTWQERSVPQPDVLNLDVSFVSEREGWALAAGSPATQCQAQPVRLWHTADGATTWTALTASGIPDGGCKEQLSFVNAQVGFMSAYDPNHPATTLQTRDGGKTWAGQTLADPPGFTSQTGGFTLRPGRVRGYGTAVFVDAAGLTQTEPRRYVFAWQSNGPTFQYVATVPNGQDAFAFAGGPGGGDLRWLLIGAAGASQESTNGGQSWHAFTTDYRQAAPVAPTVTFADGAVGYATVRGSIQRTTDGGAHWNAVKTPGT